MKKLLLIFLVSLFIIQPVTVMAEQEDRIDLDEIQQSPNWTGYNVRVGGGPELGLFRLDLGDLNRILADSGFPELSNNVFVYGSNGIAGRKVGNRFGGITMRGTTNNRSGEAKSELSVNYKGLLYKRGFYATRDLEISAGALLGTGNMELRLLSDEPGDFENIIGDIADSRHNTSTMEKSFIVFNPRVNLAYSIIGPIDISASAGYLFTHDFGSNWEISDRKISNGPLSNFRAFNLTFKLFIGF